MSSAFTILCPRVDYTAAWNSIHAFQTIEKSNDGDSGRWERISVTFSEGVIDFNSLVRQEPGDKFSKLILSMHNFFRIVKTDSIKNKEYVLDRILATKMMLGVVGVPHFLETYTRLACAWSVDQNLGSIIFNGDAMLDLDGERILTGNGEADVVL